MRNFMNKKEVPTIVLLIFAFIYLFLLAQDLHAQDIQPKKDTTTFTKESVVIQKTSHQRFKGVEIDDTKEEFVRKLYETGFGNDATSIGDGEKYTARPSNDGLYEGYFAGYPIRSSILTTPLSGTVYCVVSYVAKSGMFEDAYNDYGTFQNNLTAVYGQPFLKKEEFKTPFTRGDGYSIKALKEGKANFQSAWKTDYGVIHIRIVPTVEGGACLLLTYTDDANDAKNEQEKTEIIRRDL